jgi:hypothetical protein
MPRQMRMIMVYSASAPLGCVIELPFQLSVAVHRDAVKRRPRRLRKRVPTRGAC